MPQSKKSLLLIVFFFVASFFIGLNSEKIYNKLLPSEEEIGEVSISEIAGDEERISFYLEKLGPKQVMAKLLEESGGGSEFDCHQPAHLIGRKAYQIYGAEVFGQGDANCHSGFYHGAMEGFLAENGTINLSENIERICGQFQTSFSNFECLHGVGHGVMVYAQYDLPKALETCKDLGTPFAQSSCFGGVFMENVVAAQGFGALPGYETEWVSDDPHFPCNAVEEDINVQIQCYLMQTSRMLDIYSYDFSLVAKECQKAPEGLKKVCFQSLGRDIAGSTLRDTGEIILICNEIPNIYLEDCITGGLNVIIDFWGENLTNQPFELCKKINSVETKGTCYKVLAGRLVDVFGDSEKISEICSFSEEEYKDVCLGGL